MQSSSCIINESHIKSNISPLPASGGKGAIDLTLHASAASRVPAKTKTTKNMYLIAMEDDDNFLFFNFLLHLQIQHIQYLIDKNNYYSK